jgi:hypothetical protein
MSPIRRDDQQALRVFQSFRRFAQRRSIMIKRLWSEYLLRPRRTLPEACRDIAATHPERSVKDCAVCPNGQLCEWYRRIARDRRDRAMGCACETGQADAAG